MSLAANKKTAPSLNDGPRLHPEDYGIELTGGKILIPKYRDEGDWLKDHIEYRVRVRRWCEESDENKAQAIAWCKESPLFWFNTFVWTYRQRVVEKDGTQRSVRRNESRHVPFCTWVVQDEAIMAIIDAVNGGYDLGIDKSREMGASWLVLGTFHWLWLFEKEINLGEMSRKAELVDDKSSDSLFWKHDYINRYLPPWMLPEIDRSHMRIMNRTNGSQIVGETTGPNAGQAARCVAFLVDEASRLREFEQVYRALADTCSTRIPTSTPNGPTHFSKVVTDGSIKVERMGWWRHPEKSRDLRIGPHPKRPTEKAILSDWYIRECARRSARDVAENLDIDHTAAGAQFFDRNTLVRHEHEFAKEPSHTGMVRFKRTRRSKNLTAALANLDHDAVEFVPGAGKNKLKVWGGLTETETGLMMLPQDRNYVLGCDISQGLEASESTAVGIDNNTGEQVVELAVADQSPDEFATSVALLGLWMGGRRGLAFVGWESNGVGQRFGRELVRRIAYPWYLRQRDDKNVGAKVSQKLGWTSSTEAKIDILGELDRAQATDQFITRSKKLLDQEDSYVWYENRVGVGPGLIESATSDARALHGDVVIGAAIAQYCRRMAPRLRDTTIQAVKGTISERLAGTPEGDALKIARDKRLRSYRKKRPT